jgi:hypothetical protein
MEYFGIFYDHLAYLRPVCVFNGFQVHFTYCQFVIFFFYFWFAWGKKNLATLTSSSFFLADGAAGDPDQV